MTSQISNYLTYLVFLIPFPQFLLAQQVPVIEYGENYVVFEAEATESDLDLWVKRIPDDPRYYIGNDLEAINHTYLEFTGNNLNGGTAKSPLTYTFVCPKTANYRLALRMYQPLGDHEENDKRNDVYVRLVGNYTSECVYPKHILETDHKFWGRGVRKWGSCHSMEAHINGKKHLDKVVYGLIEGEEYTFTMSGRAQGCSIDYILLYEESLQLNVTNVDIAVANAEIYRPGLGLVEPTGIYLPDSVEVRKGITIELDVVLEPENAYPEILWSSSDETVISVNMDGLATAHGDVGQYALVQAVTPDNSLIDSSVVSIVEWYPIDVEAIDIPPDSIWMVEGQNISLDAEVIPESADIKELAWTSSDDKVAYIDSLGTITARTSGTIVITATSVENGAIFDEVVVLVEEFVDPFVAFDDEDKYLATTYKVGEEIEVTCSYNSGNFETVREGIKFWLREVSSEWVVTAEVYNHVVAAPAGTSSGTVSWTIPTNNILPSDELPNGSFYFLYVTFTNSNGVSVNKGIHPIIVERDPIPVTEVYFDSTFYLLEIGETVILDPIVLPTNADDRSVTWHSDEPAIASVTASGEVTALSPGTTDITATSAWADSLNVTATITVSPLPLKIKELNNDELFVYPNPSFGGTINIKGLNLGTHYLDVFDISGVAIVSEVVELTKKGSITMKMDNPPSGPYFLSINRPGQKGQVMMFFVR